jgi:hypothetical protein
VVETIEIQIIGIQVQNQNLLQNLGNIYFIINEKSHS